MICSDMEVAPMWQNLLNQFRGNPAISTTTCKYDVPIDGSINIVNQFDVLSSLPNHHRWCWTDCINPQFKFEQRFSTSNSYYPGSPRNRIIQAWCYRDSPEDIISACLSHLVYGEGDVVYPKRKQGNVRRVPQHSIKRVRRSSPPTMPLVPSENLAVGYGDFLFQYFVMELFRMKGIFWRVKTPEQQIVVMNGYDSQTGDFKVSF